MPSKFCCDDTSLRHHQHKDVLADAAACRRIVDTWRGYAATVSARAAAGCPVSRFKLISTRGWTGRR
jgi:hypothetical protein